MHPASLRFGSVEYTRYFALAAPCDPGASTLSMITSLPRRDTRRTSLFHFLFLATLGLASCQPQDEDSGILVSAAISLRPAFEEIKTLHESRSPHRIQFNFAASGLLATQIRRGAPVDVFASASPTVLARLRDEGRLLDSTRRLLAGNRLALLVPSAMLPVVDRFESLASVDSIALGNPETVPAGAYARECLKALGLWARLSPRLVFAENARQILDYTARGEVDAGITYTTDARILQGSVSVVSEAPADCHSPIVYGIAVVKESAARVAALAFVETATGPEAVRIFEAHGFSAPPTTYQ